jgi:hypothetical protein
MARRKGAPACLREAEAPFYIDALARRRFASAKAGWGDQRRFLAKVIPISARVFKEHVVLADAALIVCAHCSCEGCSFGVCR